MTEKDNQDGKDSQINIKYFEEPAFLTAFITASLYFVGYGYYTAYFSRFSVPLKFINIGIIDYMTLGFLPVVLLSIFIVIFFGVWSHVPKNFFEAFLGNLLPIILILITCGEAILINDDIYMKYFFLGVALILVLFLIYISCQKESMAYFVHESGFILKIGLMLIIIGGLFSLSAFLGDHNANNFIHGKDDRLEIQLSLKDKMNTQLHDKTFILIMLQDNKYYISEINKNVSEYPILYIIPTDEVEMATVHTRIKNT